MKKISILLSLLGFGASTLMFQSCLNDDNSVDLNRPTALVTVCPDEDESFTMRLDNSTTLIPTNIKKSPYGKKEVRALVNYTESANETPDEKIRNVQVNWLDSIRTKLPVTSAGENNDKLFGNDPIEIVRDWVTIAEDGYLTLRIRTMWGYSNTPHIINLLTGSNPDDPFELELRHDANGDTYARWGDALIAFNLNGLPRAKDDEIKIKLKWKSFSGDKDAEFEIEMRPDVRSVDTASLTFSNVVE